MGVRKAKVIFWLAILAVVFGLAVYFSKKDNPPVVFINGARIEVEIADSLSEKARGLSGMEGLGQNEGMFFVFDEPGYYSFWMKDMKFPIDIIWIANDKKIIDITKNASPGSYPSVFKPASSARYVLELNAGFADKHEIKIGDWAEF